MYIELILQCHECKNLLDYTPKMPKHWTCNVTNAKTLDISVEFHIECIIYSMVYMRRRVPGDFIHLVDV